jgi:hypothetical protein
MPKIPQRRFPAKITFVILLPLYLSFTSCQKSQAPTNASPAEKLAEKRLQIKSTKKYYIFQKISYDEYNCYSRIKINLETSLSIERYDECVMKIESDVHKAGYTVRDYESYLEEVKEESKTGN